MKKTLFLVVLVATVAFTCLTGVSALYEDSEIYTNSRAISPGLIYTQSSFADENDNIQSAFIFELEKSSGTQIKLAYGDYVFGADTLSSMVKQAEQGGKRVTAAVNADFFSMTTGIPMSLLMDEGVLVSGDDGRFGFGVKQDGSYIIGAPQISFLLKRSAEQSLDISKQQPEQNEQQPDEQTVYIQKQADFSVEIDQFNKYPSVYAEYLLTDTFAPTTKTRTPNTEIVLQRYTQKTDIAPSSDDESEYFALNGRYYLLDSVKPQLFESEMLVVTQVRKGSVDGVIPQGAYVLCLDEAAYEQQAQQFETGDEFVLEISANEQWRDVVHAVGNGGRIVRDGIYTDESYDAQIYNTPNPRTALGITEEGNLVVYAVDGRKTSYSTGMTIKNLAKRLIDLGCVEAINFDGGGSTTVFAALPGQQNSLLQNQPSNVTERKISNSLLFINSLEPTGNLLSVRSYPEVNLVLANSTFEIESLLGYDDNYYPLEINSPVTYTADDDAIIFEQNRGYVTDKTGQHEIYAEVNGSKYPCGVVTVLEKVDAVTLNIDKKLFDINENAKINVGAVYKGTQIPCLLSSFTYNDGSLQSNYVPNEKYVLKTDNVEIDTQGNVKVLRADEIITVKAYYNDQYDYVSFMASGGQSDESDNQTDHETDNETHQSHQQPKPVEYPETNYRDVDGHWAEEYILKCREMELMKGENTEIGTIFRPEDSFSVAELCTVMARLCKYDLSTYESFPLPFEDAEQIPAWAIPYIKAMYFNGKLDLIISDNVIGANKPITRIDVMAVCGTLCPAADKSYISFNDISYNGFDQTYLKSSDIALQNKLRSANNALCSKIFYGYDDNTLRPTESFTRAQAATVFVRLCETLGM